MKNNKYSIISTVQAMLFMIPEMIVQLKVYIIFSQSDDWSSLKLRIASQTWQLFNLYYNSDISDNI